MFRTTLRAAAVLAVVVSATSASTALAADAPVRRVDFDPYGDRTASSSADAISPDGREVLVRQGSIGIRDLAAAKTTYFDVSEVWPYDAGRFFGASDDNRRFLYTAGQALDPDDTNGGLYDHYAYDRDTHKHLLATRGADGKGISSNAESPILSGDGKIVLLRDKRSSELIRVTLDTGAVQVIGKGTLVAPSYKRPATDRAGTVAVTTTGILVGTRLVPLPAGVNLASFVVADDGSAVAFFQGSGDAVKIKVVSTADGAVRDVALPLWVKRQTPRMFDFDANGSKVLLGVRQPRGTAVRLMLGSLDVATGALAQVGGDLPYPASGNLDYVTPDWRFATTFPYAAQLGSTPLPGVDVQPPVRDPRPAAEYVDFNAGCLGRSFPWVTTRPSIRFTAPQLDPVPGRADVTITSKATGQVVGTVVLNGVPAQKQLAFGWGGYTLGIKISFQDGRTVTGTKDVPAYVPESCVWYW